jgi:hypothetical protein
MDTTTPNQSFERNSWLVTIAQFLVLIWYEQADNIAGQLKEAGWLDYQVLGTRSSHRYLLDPVKFGHPAFPGSPTILYFFKEVARGGERTRVLSISFILSFFTTLPLSHSGSPPTILYVGLLVTN